MTTHIDNMSALMALVKGGSAAWDLSHLATVAHVALAVLDATAWWEWVPSVSNAADGGTRAGVTDAVAAQLGVPLVEVEFPSFFADIFDKGPTELVQLLVEGFNGDFHREVRVSMG